MGKLQEYVQRVYGFDTDTKENPEITQATTDAQKVFSNNPNRVEALIANLGDHNCYWGLSSEVTTSSGNPIDKAGGKDVLLAVEDGELVGREIWIIADGTTAIYTLEVVAM